MITQINLSLINNHSTYPIEINNFLFYQTEAIKLINKDNKALF